MSTDGSVLAIAVPAAVVGAASFGMASVVQQQATKKAPQLAATNPRLLVALVRDPVWIGSVVTVVAGLSLQMVGLAFGPLMLVQPLLLSSLLFAAVFAAWFSGRRPDRILLLGVVCCIAGLSTFLAVARPTAPRRVDIGMDAVPLAALFAAIVAACVVVSFRARDEVKVLALALATGVLYGVTAALLKTVAAQLRFGGITAPFTHWTLYAVCVVGPSGFLLSQHAFQRGMFLSPALTIIAVTDPLVSVAAGASWFGERPASSPGALAGESLGALVLVAGVALLAKRGAHLRRESDRAGRAVTGG
ncbi:DMT family transporter [Saccharopolyspora rosea]|uniref:DMT family transporter n=1 Tax=Saccharopolyspora rosea TaxID=524884 RepID=A0ABW3FR32_9PSEU|nr:DMT family transporter [Saccharopolyspora rosea]